jgi:hypothetical protein
MHYVKLFKNNQRNDKDPAYRSEKEKVNGYWKNVSPFIIDGWNKEGGLNLKIKAEGKSGYVFCLPTDVDNPIFTGTGVVGDLTCNITVYKKDNYLNLKIDVSLDRIAKLQQALDDIVRRLNILEGI